MLRKRIGVFVCAMSVLLVAACSSSDNKPSDGPVTLTVWDFSVPDPKVTKQIDDAFTRANPNVTIKRVHQPAETFPTLIRSAMASKKGPDVFTTFAGKYVLDFPGVLQLDDLMEKGDEASVRGWKESAALAGGKHFFVPYDGGGTMMYYNKALFRKAGLDPEAPPATWDELLTACDKLNDAGVVPFSGGFKDGGLGELLVANFAPQFIPDNEAEASVAKPDWKGEAVSKSFDLMREMYDRECFTPNSEGINLFPDVVNNFKSEKAAMTLGFISGDVHWKIFRETSWGKADLGGALFPLVRGSLWDEQRLQSNPSTALAITKFTKNPEVAYEYARFFGNQQNGELLFDEAGVLPLSVDADPKSNDDVANEILGWLANRETFLGGPIGAIGANVEAALLRVVPQVVSGKKSWDDVSDQVQSEQDKADG